MRRLVVLALAGTMLAGCTAAPSVSVRSVRDVPTTSPSPTPTYSPPAPTYNPPPAADEVGFLYQIRHDPNVARLADVPDKNMLDFGWAMCHALENGWSRDQVLNIETTFPRATIAGVYSAATQHLCPGR